MWVCHRLKFTNYIKLHKSLDLDRNIWQVKNQAARAAVTGSREIASIKLQPSGGRRRMEEKWSIRRCWRKPGEARWVQWFIIIRRLWRPGGEGNQRIAEMHESLDSQKVSFIWSRFSFDHNFNLITILSDHHDFHLITIFIDPHP